jgi:D-alanyl-lipoteichoic acid acyltransferase DltB (MBOAT superfamily)
MLFSSNAFIFLFLPMSLLGFQVVSRFGRLAMLGWLTGVSLFFYGYWNPRYLILLGASIGMNFLFSKAMGAGRSEKTQSLWLTVAIIANLGLLVYYKYLFPLLNFFSDRGVFVRHFADVVLPLGISFFTFTQIAYLIDVRQGIAKRQGIVHYSFFVTFFPHLIAGPIIHPRELMPQLDGEDRSGLKLNNLALGVSWFVMGLAKKVLIADRIAPLSDILFAHPTSAGLVMSWLGVLAYSMQLYFDFSGYSDMAVALARMFGIEFPVNFNSPFKSPCVIEFWQRWHMTLSRYLNEYLYTPILRWVNGRRMDAGKKVSRRATATPEGFMSMVLFPYLSTMFLAGIWHGAGLQFLVFGVLHGLYLSINQAWRLLTPKGHWLHQKVPMPFMVVLTYLCVLVGLVFFRAESLGGAFHILGTMAGLNGRGPSFGSFPYLGDIPSISKFLTSVPATLAALSFCFLIVWGLPNTQEILGQSVEDRGPSLLPRLLWRPTMMWSLSLSVVFCVVMMLLDSTTSFLYFQF